MTGRFSDGRIHPGEVQPRTAGGLREVATALGAGVAAIRAKLEEVREVNPMLGQYGGMQSTMTMMHLMQMIRDEAHRFALQSHRRRRNREDLLSRLEGIPGVGPVRRRALLSHFRSLEEVRIAPAEEIAGVKGLNLPLALKIKETLQ